MNKITGWMAASAAALWTAAAQAQGQAQTPAIEGGASPIFAGVFAAMMLGLVVWFVVAMVRAENKRKTAGQNSA